MRPAGSNPFHSRTCTIRSLMAACAYIAFTAVAADSESSTEPWLKTYEGPTRTDIDATTLDGKVLCGYQGWFNTPGDGTRFGFPHWAQGLDRTNGERFTIIICPDEPANH